MAASAPQVAAVRELLPADAEINGWTDEEIVNRWTGGIYSTVRAYWYQRVSDTASYIDLSDAGGSLPATQQYRQAREMLDYWDNWLVRYGDSAVIVVGSGMGRKPLTFGKIKNRHRRDCAC